MILNRVAIIAQQSIVDEVAQSLEVYVFVPCHR